MAETVQGCHIVSDKHDCAALVAHAVEDVEALLRKGGVAHRQHLVDEKNVRVDLDRYGEREADVHSRRVVLELELLELAQFGEVDHLVIARLRLAWRETHHDPVQDDVVACGQVLVETHAELDEGRKSPVHPDSPAVDAIYTREALQHRALAAAVAAGDPKELTLAYLEGDVVERLERLVAGPSRRVQSALLESMRALLRHVERLADRLDDDRRKPTACRSRHQGKGTVAYCRRLMSHSTPSLPTSPDDPLLDDWYHTIDLGGGLVSHGYFDHRTVVDCYGIPDSLAGMTVLDVGAGDGFFALEFERRGAERVLAIDVGSLGECDMLPAAKSRLAAADRDEQPWLKRFQIAHEMLGSRVEYKTLSVYDLCPELVGMFDFVFCADVLLHLQNPLQALLNIRSVSAKLAIVETPIEPELDRNSGGLPYLRFGVLSAEKQAGDHNTYWLFTTGALCDMLVYAGFSRVEPQPVFELPPRGLAAVSVVAHI